MTSGVEPDEIIGLIYEAAMDSGALDPLLNMLIAAVDGSSGWLIEVGPNGLSAPATHNMSEEVLRRYVEHYHTVDPWMIAAQGVARIGMPINFDHLVPEQRFRTSEVYRDLIQAGGADVLHNLTLPLSDGPTFVAIMRGDGAEAFGEPQERLLRHLAPHLVRMTAIRQLVRPTLGTGDLRLAHPVLHLDALGRVMDINAAAQRLLARGNLLTLDGRRYLACSASPNRALAEGMQRCIRRHVPASVAIPDTAGIPHRVHMAPGPRGPVGSPRPAVIVTVRDMASEIPARIDAAQSTFGLSASEAALVRGLLLGQSLGQQASARQTARETVRKQLASIFAKVGVARQAELVATIWMLPLN